MRTVVSVGATENLMIAAVGAQGTTRIENAAREPEIDDLALFLTGLGARILGVGTSILTIEAPERLGSTIHEVVPDRIELGTLACAAALTDGELRLVHGRLDLLGGAGDILQAAGVDLQATAEGLVARRAAGKGPTACTTTAATTTAPPASVAADGRSP